MRKFLASTLGTLILTLAFIVLTVGVAQAQDASTCPLGKKDTFITLQRVMINFGKFIGSADDLVTQAVSGGASVTDDDLRAAIQDLTTATACANIVVIAPNESLWPAGARKLSGDEQLRYLAEFRQAMSAFSLALTDYSKSLEVLIGQSPRDFTDAAAQKKRITKMADEAHAHFN